jgi:aminoglycoside/choline kinase family phosphotransferase
VPVVLCRGDAQRRNLFARRDPDGRERTVAVDWASLHRGHAGTDIATLVHQALMYFDADVTAAPQLDRAVFEAYLDGLAAGGRLACAAA